MPKLHNENAGVAMIMALIVGLVVMAFCLSLILVSYTLYAQTTRKTTQMQCKMLAQSYAECMKEELKDNDSDLAKYIRYKMQNTGSEVWVPTNATPEELAQVTGRGASPYSVLRLEVDAAGYCMYVSLSYQTGESSGSDTADTPDDEDGDVVAGGTVGGTSIGKNRLIAEIECIRGFEVDRDKQSYTVECEYLINAN